MMRLRFLALALPLMVVALFPVVVAAEEVAPKVDGLISKHSAHSVDETIARFEAALKERGFIIFAHLDHAAAAASVGLKMPRATVVVFGNPRIGTPNFLKHPTLAIDLPIKALVWEDAAGKAWLSYNSEGYLAAAAYARHGVTPDPELADRIERQFAAIAEAATQ